MFCGTVDGNCYGFYLEKDRLRDDYVEISMAEYRTLLRGQSKGKRIVFHSGAKPTLEEPIPPSEYEVAQRKIRELKSYLSETDYVSIKIAEGAAIAEEYADVLQKRREAREEINRLELIKE